jgi:hypothetical protein
VCGVRGQEHVQPRARAVAVHGVRGADGGRGQSVRAWQAAGWVPAVQAGADGAGRVCGDLLRIYKTEKKSSSGIGGKNISKNISGMTAPNVKSILNFENDNDEYYVCRDAYHSVASDMEYNIYMKCMFSFRIKKTHYKEERVESLLKLLTDSLKDPIKETCKEGNPETRCDDEYIETLQGMLADAVRKRERKVQKSVKEKLAAQVSALGWKKEAADYLAGNSEAVKNKSPMD